MSCEPNAGRIVMTITIPPELEGQVRARAKAEGLTVEAYIEHLIQGHEWAEFSADHSIMRIQIFQKPMPR